MTEKKFKEIKAFVKTSLQHSKDLQHDWGHVVRVNENAQQIVRILNLKKHIDINLLSAICLLHDINYSTYSQGIVNYFLEGRRSKKILYSILADLDVNLDERSIIIDSISSSSFSFPFGKLNKNKDLYTQILQDADTIDFFSKERLISYKKSKERVLFYKLISPFSKFAVNYGKKNLHNYLNYKELAKHFYV